MRDHHFSCTAVLGEAVRFDGQQSPDFHANPLAPDAGYSARRLSENFTAVAQDVSRKITRPADPDRRASAHAAQLCGAMKSGRARFLAPPLAFLVLAGGAGSAAAANFTCGWNGATANWQTSADWSNCNGAFPNNGGGNTFDASLTAAGTYTVTLSTTVTVGSVTINNSAATLAISNGTLGLTGTLNVAAGSVLLNGGTISGGTLATSGGGTIQNVGTAALQNLTNNGTFLGNNGTVTTLAGTITNNGTINVNSTSANTFLQLTANTSLAGTGTVALSGPLAFINQQSANLTLTNVGNTIQGRGQIGNDGLTLVNQAGGTINANDAAGPLLVNAASVTNQGLMEATGGGTLQTNTGINNTGGTISANGSVATVQFLNGTAITGGTLTTANGGVLGTAAGQTVNLQNLTLTNASTYRAADGSVTRIAGTITNNGAINLNSATANTLLQLAADTSLTGGGTVTMSGPLALINQASANLTLTNVNNTIQGRGQIGNDGLTLVNQASGVITANDTAGPLLVNAASVTNQGLMQATGGGTLQTTTGINNTGGSISASGSGSAVQFLSGTTISGGTLSATGGGVLGTAAGQTVALQNLTNTNTYGTGNGSITQIVGTITNNGAINLSAGASNTFLQVAGGNTTLSGGGTVTLSESGAGVAVIDQQSANLVLINANNTLQGAGQIGNNGLTLTNQAAGIINANAASPLLINAASVTNQGLMEATGGGTLQTTTGINNTGGSISASGSGSAVQFLSGTTISGGTLSTAAGGVLGTAAGQTVALQNLTNAGTYGTGDGSITQIVGTINNTGAINLSGGASNTFLQVAGGNVSLAGGGTVTMSGPAFINQASANLVLTNTNNLIQGAGQIGNNGLTLVNQGTIDANQTGQVLTVNPTSTTNAGLLEATNGGILQLSNGTINNQNGIIKVDGATSSVQFVNGAIIQGGTLSTTNNGVLGVGASNTIALDGSTLGQLTNAGTYTTGNGSITQIVGTINNTGAINLSGGASNTFLQVAGGNVSLTGGGTVTMSGPLALINQASANLTLTNVNNTIQGRGQIGNDGLTLVNQASGVITANDTAGPLLVNAASVTNQGLMQATGGGTLQTTTGINNTGGSISASGSGSAVQFLSGTTISGGTLSATGGGVLGTAAGQTVALQNLTNTNTYGTGNGSITQIVGTITNNGAINLSAGASNTFLQVAGGNTTLSGGGTVTLSESGAGVAVIDQQSANLVLINANNTLQGAGQIGNNGLTLTNQAAGIINANAASPLLINAASVTNQGLMEATGGGTLQTTTGINNTGGSISASGSGSAVQFLSGTTISGGTLSTAAGGVLGTAAGQTVALQNLTNAGTYGTGDGSITQIVGTINNTGAINLSGGASNTFLQVAGGNVSLAGGGTVTMSGPAFINQASANLVLTNTNNLIQGAGQIGNNGLTLVNQGTIDANQTGQVLTVNPTSTTNAGLMRASNGGTLNATVGIANSGTLQAAGGTFNANAGFTGVTGTARVDAGGQLNVGAASTVGTLINNGTTATALNLGANSVTVSTAYTNANFGTGNSFNNRANVAGTGQILAAGNVGQAISGANVTNGTTATPTLAIGNVRVGATTFNYQISNTGTTGPSLQGAIQTAVNGGNINDARLSGTGVTAGNWGPIGTGTSTPNLAVTFTANAAGALAPLTGQAVAIVNNFDNVAKQTMNIVVGSGAAAYQVAQPSLPASVNFGNFRVGSGQPTSVSQAITVGNTLVAPGFQEGLNAAAGGTTGQATIAGGPITNLAAGSSSTAISVGLSGLAAGANSGTAAVNLASNGTGTSGLATLALPSQTISVSGTGYNVAAGNATPSPVAIGNQRIGGTNAQALTVNNTAPVGSFTEVLNASFGANTGAATNNAGSISGGLGAGGVAGGGANSTALSVGVDTTSAGAKSGTVTVNYQSNGAGSSGLSSIGVGSQVISVSGNVYQAAVGQLNTAPLNFGTVQVGQTVSQALSISNVATGPTGFVEDLNARFGSTQGTGANLIQGTGSISGLVAGGTNTNGMTVTVNTAAAGSVSGSIAVNFFTAGAVNGTSNGLGEAQVGSTNYGVVGTISAQVVDQAKPVINNPTIDLGSVRIGTSSPTAFVSLTNQATGNPQAALNASISASAPITASGAFTLLAPGGTNANSLQVGMNTGAAGAVSGTATVALVSDASNIGGCGSNCQLTLPSQNVAVSGKVYQVAQPTVPATVNLGNFRLGNPVGTSITVGNTLNAPVGFQEGLDASVSATSGKATGSGSITNLAAGGSSTAISVGLTGATAGANTGTVTLALASNGSTTSGLSTLSLGTQNVAVSGTGYRVANPTLNTPSITIAARVGDALPVQSAISVTNSSPDQYTEGLKASVATTPAGFTSSGSIANLAAGQTDASSLKVGLASTATAGTTAGTVALNLASTGAGTTGAADQSLGPQNVNVTGKVYTPAQATLASTSVSFGIVHVGDVVTQALSITNSAPTTALNDVLVASLGGATSGFAATGNLGTGLAAGATNSTALNVGLNTAAAGVFTGSATLTAASRNQDMADLTLAAQNVSLTGQVNNYARSAFQQVAGSGSFSQSGSIYTINFGTLLQGTSGITASLLALNSALGPADLLSGTYSFGALTDVVLSGFNPFADLAAGSSIGGLLVAVSTSALGVFDDLITLNGVGSNASGYSASIGAITLELTGTVSAAAVPEPDGISVLVLAAMAFFVYRARRAAPRRSRAR